MDDETLLRLIPGIAPWAVSVGPDPVFWAGVEGRMELAIGYSFMFWPGFVRIGPYIFLAGITEDDVAGWEANGTPPAAIEGVLNHQHILDLHQDADPAPTEEQVRYLGRTLAQIYGAKLRLDFPDIEFVVTFNDEPGLDLIDYQFSFWQKHLEQTEQPVA